MDLYSLTISTKLRDFQYRLLLNTIVLNRKLFHYNIRDNDRCYYCITHRETVIHLFVECKIIAKFWNRIERWVKKNLALNDTLDFNAHNIIFNQVYPSRNHLVNMTVLFAKQFIFRIRC